MGKKAQHQGETSQAAITRSKRQRLAALEAFRAAEHPIQPPPSPPALETLHAAEHPIQPPPSPPASNPNHNTAPSSNVNPTNSANPHNSNNSADPHDSRNADSSSDEIVRTEKTRKKRGRTMMKSFSWTPDVKAEIEFNEFGQPIGPNSKHLSSYLGTLAREMVPMTISDWRTVDKTLKDDLWTCIQTRFVVDTVHKELLMRMLGLRWKEAKSRLVSSIKDAATSPDYSTRLAMLKPDNIKSVQEWNDFIKEKLSARFELTSQKFKALRAKSKLPHTMSRKGYARLAEELKKEKTISDLSRDDLWCKAHTRKNGEPPNSVVANCIAKIKEHNINKSSQEIVSLSEDGVSQVFGHEHRGHVRGLGLGVVPSQLGIHQSNSKRVSALANKVSSLEARLQELTNLFMNGMTGN